MYIGLQRFGKVLATVPGDVSARIPATRSSRWLRRQTAVGTRECGLCVCDVNDSETVTATDALFVLRLAVGQKVLLACPACE